MRKYLLLVALTAVLALNIQSCGTCSAERGYCENRGGDRWSTEVRGSGKVAREERQIQDVKRVSLATIGDLSIEISDREQLHIEADENLLEYLETSVRNGTLKIATRSNTNLRPTKPIKYYLTVRALDMIAVSSSGNIVAPDLKSRRFSVIVSSSGNVEVGELDATHVDVGISSSGDVYIEKLTAETLDIVISSAGNLSIDGGAVRRQEVTISSSGSYRALPMSSETARVRLSSSGNAHIQVTDDLNAVLSSSGSVRYAGNPTVEQTTSSSGRVRQVSD